MKCLTLPNASLYEPEECAREIYEEGAFGTGSFWSDPGTIWSYHSLHLQVAGAMAAKAAGLSVRGLLEKYLIRRLRMTSTSWAGYPNPHLAASMVTTGNDYDKLLQAVLTYEIAPKEIIDQMEFDAYRAYPGLVPSPYPKDVSLGFYGHYSMCTYFECVGQAWSEQCEANGIHADPGAFGYWPLIDRSKGYYMQFVVFRPVEFNQTIMQKYKLTQDTLAALPGHCTSPLRFEVQSFVEKAMGKVVHSGEPQRFNSTAKDDPLAYLCKLAEEVPSSLGAPIVV
jgi:CubicO group peptidase (beta-lactamase class C family)